MKKINQVLLVEDNDITVLLTNRLIEKTEKVNEVTVCYNGKEAYDKIQEMLENGKPLPEILLLDLVMPVWDGWEFLERFTPLKESEQVEIFILTSSISKEDMEKAERFGLMNNYLVKPISFSKLNELFERRNSPA
ncbi:MAG: response regulator [Balneolaceae bacterium]|nr:MAG: response regulator [Balneolaceae bacterium]